MAVDEGKYRLLRDAGFTHAAALDLADNEVNVLGIGGSTAPPRPAAFRAFGLDSVNAVNWNYNERAYGKYNVMLDDRTPTHPEWMVPANSGDDVGLVVNESGLYRVDWFVAPSLDALPTGTDGVVFQAYLSVNDDGEAPGFYSYHAAGPFWGDVPTLGSVGTTIAHGGDVYLAEGDNLDVGVYPVKVTDADDLTGVTWRHGYTVIMVRKLD